MRAVLDGNVLVSALLSPSGAPARCVAHWLRGDFELIVSERLLDELERTLAYPKLRQRLSEENGLEFLSILQRSAIRAADPDQPTRRSSDPGDDYLLALAEQERALLVSGDAHLLALADRLPVLAPAAFLERLSTELGDQTER